MCRLVPGIDGMKHDTHTHTHTTNSASFTFLDKKNEKFNVVCAAVPRPDQEKSETKNGGVGGNGSMAICWQTCRNIKPYRTPRRRELTVCCPTERMRKRGDQQRCASSTVPDRESHDTRCFRTVMLNIQHERTHRTGCASTRSPIAPTRSPTRRNKLSQ